MQKLVAQSAVLVTVIVLLLACERKNNITVGNAATPAKSKYSEAEIKNLSKPGTLNAALVGTFGLPTFEERQDGDLIWTYILDDGTQSGYRFAGFTVLIKSNIVAEWRAIHMGRPASNE